VWACGPGADGPGATQRASRRVDGQARSTHGALEQHPACVAGTASGISRLSRLLMSAMPSVIVEDRPTPESGVTLSALRLGAVFG